MALNHDNKFIWIQMLVLPIWVGIACKSEFSQELTTPKSAEVPLQTSEDALPQVDFTAFPNPLVGTDSSPEFSHGSTFPSVFIPFGMANWTAVNGNGSWLYQYSGKVIRDFKFTHRAHVWLDDYGFFSLMPITGSLPKSPSDRGSVFSHNEEEAHPHKYSVFLQSYKTFVEMTPSTNGGMMRFTFPQTAGQYVILDTRDEGSLQIDNEKRTITGTNRHSPNGKNFALHFVIAFDQPFMAQGTWSDVGKIDDPIDNSGNRGVGYVQFAPTTKQVVVRIGTSLISAEQAALNLATQTPNFDFDGAVAIAKNIWNKELGKFEVEGGTEAQKKTFYTALYRAFQFPRLLTEYNASGSPIHYSPYDGAVHPGPMFADTGLWDTYRAQFPLLTIVQPKRVAEIMRSMVNAYNEGGGIPRWPNPGETNAMFGTHADSVIADAFIKGITDFDVEKAYEAIRKDATEKGNDIFEKRTGIEDYLRLGYVPAEKFNELTASFTMEYAYDDYCVAQMARGLGKMNDYNYFLQQSKNYRHAYDSGTGFMRSRNSDGTWAEPFDPLVWGRAYIEGNAWQWIWSVQQDIPGLIELMGGPAKFESKLDEFFNMSSDFKVGDKGIVYHEMVESKVMNMGQYAHVNEPVHHVIYLYNYIGAPWKAQSKIRHVMDNFYKPGPAGWLGDEDNGQMSSWYILSALGFYQVTPGQPYYALGTPLFDRTSVHLENGNTFTIVGERKNATDLYVQSVSLNGADIDRPWIRHSEIMNGGMLRFVLGPQPNPSWGKEKMPSPLD